jgi:hypothetical protein
MKKNLLALIYSIVLAVPSVTSAEDNRQKVDMPEMMKQHMLANMRDHLVALEEITRYLATQQYEKASDVAEQRLGMSSLESHGAFHMSHFMPKEMARVGTEMHRAASRFALAAKDAELEGGLNVAFSALSDVMTQCSACHSGYRIH